MPPNITGKPGIALPSIAPLCPTLLPCEKHPPLRRFLDTTKVVNCNIGIRIQRAGPAHFGGDVGNRQGMIPFKDANPRFRCHQTNPQPKDIGRSVCGKRTTNNPSAAVCFLRFKCFYTSAGKHFALDIVIFHSICIILSPTDLATSEKDFYEHD